MSVRLVNENPTSVSIMGLWTFRARELRSLLEMIFHQYEIQQKRNRTTFKKFSSQIMTVLLLRESENNGWNCFKRSYMFTRVAAPVRYYLQK